jgi:rRNA-processing protein FCF1
MAVGFAEMIVVVDSNAFYGDPTMRSPAFRVVRGAHQRGHLELAIPEVVLRELPKLYEEQFRTNASKIAIAAEALRKLGHALEVDDGINVDAACVAYLPNLRTELQEDEVRIPDLPQVALDELVRRAIAERRPFRAGRGFRDTLIWLNAIELAAEDEVVLVSSDKAFRRSDAEEDVLHEHLRQDLVAAGLDEERVQLHPTLDHLIRASLSSARVLDEARRLISTNPEIGEEVRRQVLDAVLGVTPEYHHDVTVIGPTQADIDNVHVDEALIYRIDVQDAYELDEEHEFALEIHALAELWFSFTTTPSGAEWLAAEHADADIGYLSETLAQGSTTARPAHVLLTGIWDETSNDLQEVETQFIEDASQEEIAQASD